jgi:hypothetical protein
MPWQSSPVARERQDQSRRSKTACIGRHTYTGPPRFSEDRKSSRRRTEKSCMCSEIIGTVFSHGPDAQRRLQTYTGASLGVYRLIESAPYRSANVSQTVFQSRISDVPQGPVRSHVTLFRCRIDAPSEHKHVPANKRVALSVHVSVHEGLGIAGDIVHIVVGRDHPAGRIFRHERLKLGN